MPPSIPPTVQALLEQQHHLITPAHVRDLGYPTSTLARLRDAGILERLDGRVHGTSVHPSRRHRSPESRPRLRAADPHRRHPVRLGWGVLRFDEERVMYAPAGVLLEVRRTLQRLGAWVGP